MFRQLVKKLIPKPVFDAIEPYGHLAEAVLANIRFGFPARKLKVIGVTGTDGKTTTCTLITAMMRSAGYKVGMMTTISVDFGDGPQPNPTRLTTISSFGLFNRIKQMEEAGVEWLVLETTSHALAQNRAWGIPFSVGVMTNVTHEHLDYHRTFERYRDAKLRLFKYVARNRKGLGAGIANADDESGDLFAHTARTGVLYGVNEGDLRATDIKSTPEGNEFTARYGQKELRIATHLPGSFNVYNALAAAGVGLVLGMAEQQVEKGIASLRSVEGRMNRIDEGQDFNVVVDYAHTPDSFEKIFAELRPLTKKRLICVFGSAGERDRIKRAVQGEVAGRLCDVVIATEEDDRSEDGQAILEEIAAGAEKAGKIRETDLYLIHDRAEAIQAAIGGAAAGDTVVLLGKGHEKSILTNQGKKEWDEVGEARKALKARLKS